jgi:hypothetical protein
MLPLLFAGLLFASCKEDDTQSKETIAGLEEKVSTLESEKVGMEADIISLKASQGGINAADATALRDRKDFLEKEVQRLLPMEMQVKELTRKNEDLAAKLAAATMSGRADASAAAGGQPSGELSKAVEQSFVTIEGDRQHGGGFVVKEGEKVFLYTAASVLAGNQKLTIRSSGGQALTKFGTFELCDGADIARMQVMDAVEFTMEMAAQDAVIEPQMPVLALGIEKNSRMVAVEKTQVSGVQGAVLELYNSPLKTAAGGPIIHAVSGKVIGVIGRKVEAPVLWPNAEYPTEVMQTVQRINRPLVWTETKIGSFLAEAKKLQEFDDNTRLSLAVASVSYAGGMPQLEGMVAQSHFTAKQVLTQFENKPLAQTLLNWKGDDPNKRLAASEADIKKRWRGVMGDALSLAQRGVAEMKVPQFSAYHRTWAEAALKNRQTALDAINDRIKENQ